MRGSRAAFATLSCPHGPTSARRVLCRTKTPRPRGDPAVGRAVLPPIADAPIAMLPPTAESLLADPVATALDGADRIFWHSQYHKQIASWRASIRQ